MKNLLTITALFISLLLISGCDKPAPTELFDDSSEDEYEVLNKNLDDQYYNSGVDTSGLEQDLRGLTNIISLSGIKITNDKLLTYHLPRQYFLIEVNRYIILMALHFLLMKLSHPD